ncbi:MAG: DNA polymerase III subunit alpha, partial [Chloroflexi bacterium]|nr:DNA polymerase III subunit alpha [Chloroflexota bacterium]
KFVRERDIFFAVRGSAAASLVLFCLGVTNINPLPYRLVFERFLNVERKEMPDIDMDFQDDRREEVINYVVSKYGREHVAQIITFGTLGARASIRDVGRALAMPYADVDRVAKLVPFKLHITLDEAMELNPEFRDAYDSDDSIKRLIDTGRKLEGLTRHSSTHAAGVVISKEPLDDVVPLQRPTKGDEDGVSMTQYAMEPLAALGLLKMDFLGLVNLSILARARNLIMATQGVEIVLQDIPLDDEKTFDLLSRGETVGVFQMEGSGMTRYIKELKPNSLADVAAMIALYRPGPMEHITAFIEAKHGVTEVRYPHPALKDLLEETYGIIVYQDQVLQIFRTFAGYSLGEADIVRKAMGKKIAAIMAEERENFIQGALKNGYAQEIAEELFVLITPFAGYAFNKAHSISYGLISYWTAYLKANYPAEYMVSLLNSYIDSTDRTATAVSECRRMMIQVLPPDITKSEEEFSIEVLDDGQQAIRFGMAAVKNVGAAALRPVIEARKKEGPFESIEQMCRAADMSGVNRKTLESLIKVGAFDMFGGRSGLISVIDRIISLAQSEARLKDSDQTSMFDLFGESVPTPLSNLDIPDIPTPEGEKWAWEKELLGVPLSNNSLLTSLVNDADPDTVVFLNQIDTDMGGKKLKLRGQVASVIQRYTRESKPFSIVTLGLMDGTVEVFVWENVLEETQGLWEEGKLVTITGTVRVREEQISISCANASEYKVPDAADATASENVEGYALSEAGYSNGASQSPVTNGTAQPLNNVSSIADKRASNGYVERAAEQTNSRTPQRLSLRIRETDTPTKDNYLLEDVKRLLLEFRGEDEVNLQIVSDGRIITLEWPLVRVNVCPQLEEQLREILGDAGQVFVESIAR